MKPRFIRIINPPCAALTLAVAFATGVQAADQFFDGSTTNALTTSKWGATNAGPFTSAFTSGNTAVFATVNGTGSGASGITVAGIRAEENFTLSSPTGTLATGGTVATVNVFSGKTLDLGSLSLSTAAGTGFNKTGSGVFATAGSTYTGGFTLTAGTIIARGVNAMGSGGALTLNGGTVAGSATRDFTGKYTSGITVGGNVQFGELAANVALANDAANLTYTNNMALGGTNRILTLGNAGSVAFGGVISNTGGVGVTFAATTGGTGRFDVTGTANTYTGTTTITGGEVRFTSDASLGTAPGSLTANSIVIDGGRFATLNGATYTLNSNRGIQIGATAGTAISTPGSGILTYNGVIADKTTTTGAWAKQGGGTLALGGVSTYSGSTSINSGILQLTTGNDRLPTGTVVSIGQSASANLGTLDLNSRNQQIAGLVSTSGTSVSTTLKNTVTSTAAATFTLGGSGTYAYGDGTAANSGVITGAISLVKNGSGTQTLGDTNTYNGTTTVNNGKLLINGNISTSITTVNNGGTLGGSGTVGAVTVNSGGTLAPGNSPGILSAGDTSLLAGSTLGIEIDGTTIGSQYDQFNVTGTVSLAGLLSVTPSLALADNTLFFILANDSTDAITGTFSNAPINGTVYKFGTQDFQISYFGNYTGGGLGTFTGGNDIVLRAIPEPATALVGSLGLLALLRRRRA